MATPSLAMIPSGYKSGKVYSVLPTDGTGDLTFTRASSATRVNQSGLIELVATGVPRLDYTGGGCPSLLLEPQSTNLITYSEDFSNASWSKTDSAITINDIASPKGDLTADKLIESATNAAHYTQSEFIASTIESTFSVFVKKGERSRFKLVENATTGVNITVNLETETFTTTAESASLTSLDNGWYRVSVTRASTVSVARWTIDLLDNLGNASYLGDGTSGIYIYGAQVEQQSYATSYIPTSGSIATRIADAASKTGLSSYINSSEGVLYFEGSALANDLTSRYITISDGTTSNFVSFFFFSSSNSIRYSVTVGGVEVSDLTYTLSDITNLNKFAVSWKLNDFKLYVNGAKRVENLSGNIYSSGVLSIMDFKHPQGGNLYGKVKDLRVYKTALTDSELTTLTTL